MYFGKFQVCTLFGNLRNRCWKKYGIVSLKFLEISHTHADLLIGKNNQIKSWTIRRGGGMFQHYLGSCMTLHQEWITKENCFCLHIWIDHHEKNVHYGKGWPFYQDKLTSIWWSDFRLKPIFCHCLNCIKNTTLFKSGQTYAEHSLRYINSRITGSRKNRISRILYSSIDTTIELVQCAQTVI